MFSEISIENLRILEQAVFRPVPGLNVIGGQNGAGKTTLLEAMYLLATGRSFRHWDTAPLIREGQDYVQVVGKLFDELNGAHVLGMRRDRSNNLVVRLDGSGSVKRSEILRLMPLQFIGADPQQLASGAPELRRSFLDSGLFHVEPSYLKQLQTYGRILAQRNAALRSGSKGVREWDEQLVGFGNRITEVRKAYVDQLVTHIEDVLSDWGMDVELSFSYRNGWGRELSLGDALQRALDTDMRQHFTSVGPHRADLLINARVARSGKVLSRGQLKMMVIAMFLAQAAVQRDAGHAVRVLLFDDLGAELDRQNRNKVLGRIRRAYPQVVVTALDPETIAASTESAQMFHVEHGRIEEGS